jgi:flagellar assembly protein FliH
LSELNPGGLAEVLSGDRFQGSAAAWRLPSFDPAPIPAPPTARHLEEIEAAAYEEGQMRGYQDGLSAGRAAAAEETQRLRALLTHLQQPIAQLDADSERALVALMLEVARRLVQQELEADPLKLASIVREAVSRIAHPQRELRIRLHPDDARLCAGALKPDDPAQVWIWIPDASLMRGDCVVETDAGRVDARLDTRQAMLAQGLLGESA